MIIRSLCRDLNPKNKIRFKPNESILNNPNFPFIKFSFNSPISDMQ